LGFEVAAEVERADDESEVFSETGIADGSAFIGVDTMDEGGATASDVG